jgi:iron complex outermembrane receptor protein
VRNAVSGLLFGLALSTAFAQDDAVVITAPRFPEEVRRMPASVSVITREDIDRSAARTIPELLGSQAGIGTRDLFGNNAANATVDLRGFGATSDQNTLILLDGRRLTTFDLSGVEWAAIPLAGVERIEIMRGTGSVLYGDNASAGVINIVTRSPLQPGNSAEVLGRAASYKTVEGQLYGNHGTDLFGVNSSVYGYRSDGYRQNNRNEQENATLNTRWALGNGTLDLRFGGDRQSIRLPGARIVQPSIGQDDYASDPRGAQTPNDWAYRDGARAGMSLAQKFADAEFVLGLDYRTKPQQSYFYQGGFPLFRDDNLDLTSLSPRLRVPFNVAGMRNALVLGGDWNQWRYDSRRGDTPDDNNQPGNIVRITQSTAGYYAQDTIDLTSTTLASFGYRSERAKYSGDDTADPASPACAFGCNAAPSLRATQSVYAWEAGLRHALTPTLTPFIRANRSYRLSNAEEIYENDANFLPQFQLLRPQHAITYELGMGWRRQADALRATVFRSDITDEIHLDPFTNGIGNTNLPPSRRQGVELDGAWQALPTVRFTAAYTYTDARFLEGTFAGSPFAIGTDIPIAGKTVPLVSRHRGTLSAAWDIQPKTRLSAGFTAASSQFMDNDEPNSLGQRIPAYRVLDLKLAQTVGPARFALTVNNVFNQKYYTYAARSQFVADRYAVYPLPGTTYGVSAELRF